MWHDEPFSQRNRTTERTVAWGFEVEGKCEGAGGGGEERWAKFENEGGG